MAIRLPTPIEVAGVLKCCGTGLNGITETVAIDTGSGYDDAAGMFLGPPGALIWTGDNGGPGGFAFGVCCAQSITLRLRGNIRMHESGKDEISVYLNDGLLWTAASDAAAGAAWNDYYDAGSPTSDDAGYHYYEGTLGGPDYQEYHDITIPLTTRACGNVIKLLGGYADSYPIDPADIVPLAAFWQVEILHLPPQIP